jgi:ribonuclease-3
MAGEARRRRLRELVARSGAVVDIAKLDAAFAHESAVREGLAERSNERLEFLGDAVLTFLVARSLFERYPEASEGELHLRKAKLVNDSVLADTAERLGFEPLMLVGAGTANMPPPRRRSMLADAFEAFVAALYLEAGGEAAATFVARELVAVGEASAGSLDDPKTVLQEWTQRHYAEVPAYAERFEGPPHERVFHSEVAVRGDVLAAGSGPSKKAAQRAAAARALEILNERYGDVAPRNYSAPRAAADARG